MKNQQKQIALAITMAFLVIGCGGGGGGGSSNTEISKETPNKPQATANKVLQEGKWEIDMRIQYIESSQKLPSNSLHLVHKVIYKEYDGEYGKGIVTTMCSYHPQVANWSKVASYNGIECPDEDYLSSRSVSRSIEEENMQHKNGDFAVIGSIYIDGVQFIDYFHGEKESRYIEAENMTTPDVRKGIVKTNPSSDNRSLVCSSGEKYSKKQKSEIPDIKFYSLYKNIENGVTTNEYYTPNCINELDVDSIIKYSKVEIISNREYKAEYQIINNKMKTNYITKEHAKRID